MQLSVGDVLHPEVIQKTDQQIPQPGMFSREVTEHPVGREASDLHTLNPATTCVKTLKFPNGAHRTQRGSQEDNHPRAGTFIQSVGSESAAESGEVKMYVGPPSAG
ncbi:hypothetical protein FQN60_016556, partial [Etheostoma spectabile]